MAQRNRIVSVVYGVVVALLLFLSNVTEAAEVKAAEERTFTVGVTTALTGSLASVGMAFKNGIEIADQIFDKTDRVRFVFEDDQYLPKFTATAVRKLIAIDKIDVLIVFGTGPSLSIAPLVEKEHIPTLSLSSSPEVVRDRSYIVKHWLDPEVESKLILDFAAKWGYKSFALLTTDNDAMEAIRAAVIKDGSMKIVLDEQINSSETDLRTLAQKTVNSQADAVYLIMTPPHPGIFAKRLKELNFDGGVFAAHPVDVDSTIKQPNSPLIGAWYVTADSRQATKFHKCYRERFGQEAVTGAENGYDIAKLVIEGLRTSDLNHFLHTVKNFKGAFGTYSANGKNGFNVPAAIKKVTREGVVYADNGSASDVL